MKKKIGLAIKDVFFIFAPEESCDFCLAVCVPDLIMAVSPEEQSAIKSPPDVVIVVSDITCFMLFCEFSQSHFPRLAFYSHIRHIQEIEYNFYT